MGSCQSCRPAPAPEPEQAAEQVRVFWSGHLTIGHAARRQEWLPVAEEEADIQASLPPFNNAKKLPLPTGAGFREINVPAFGPNIANAVMRIFESEKLKGTARKLNVPLANYCLSKFVQEKMSKVHDMIKYCRSDPDISKRNNDAIDQLESFVKFFEMMGASSITNVDQWNEFVNRHASPGWEEKLHFDYLLDNFGFEKDTSLALRKQKFKKPDNEEVTFEQHSFRWLSKALAGYGPDGALTDVVNLVFAMTKKDWKDLSDIGIAHVIDAFREKIMAGDHAGLWIPTHYFMDAEIDDCLTWVLLEHLHESRSSKLNVLVQLPNDSELDETAERWGNLPNCEVWRDPDSRNAKAVKHVLLKTA